MAFTPSLSVSHGSCSLHLFQVRGFEYQHSPGSLTGQGAATESPLCQVQCSGGTEDALETTGAFSHFGLPWFLSVAETSFS